MNNLGISNNRFQQKAQQKRQKSPNQPHPIQQPSINNTNNNDNYDVEITPDLINSNFHVPIFQDPKLIDNLQKRQ
ncbi:unnamed protein product [Paramecium sonneborni]|uniref:Uncharacterized protein n=1 Tax=Paramecium sonneborni TaxID=65129 RepID=A0A8S1QG13_9CILI|nr:unnamed protein product [Paramecium sonneborni]CAD8113297.1 unnamed protein product [Paramecium sonneborni]